MKVNKELKKHKAFTLAEILVTLGVVGVIASMTVPSLVQDVQDEQLKVAWRKFYADISQATKLITNENGGSLKRVFTDKSTVIDIYAPKLNAIKVCRGDASNNCWHDTSLKAVFYSGAEYAHTWSAWFGITHGFLLSSGAFLAPHTADLNCGIASDGSATDDICIYFLADVNGKKGPNRIGKDIFIFYAHEDRMQTYLGTSADCNKSSSGFSCASKWLYKSRED